MNVITNNIDKCVVALSALHHVSDPEIGLNVVDLGLIYQLDFDEQQSKMYILMTLTTQFCPMGESISESVKTALENTFPNVEVDLALTFGPPWSFERISEEGKIFLNK